MGADIASGPVVVIELGLDRGEPETYSRPGRRTTPLWLGPALVALAVLFGAVASAPPPGPPIREVFRVPIGPGDPYALTDDGRLLLQSAGMLTSYRLADGEPVWRVGQNIPVYRLRTGNDMLLLRPRAANRAAEPGTTALSLRTGAREWRHDREVVSFPGIPLMFAVDAVRSLSSSRRVQNTVEAIDPDAGLPRWRVEVPSTAVLIPVPGVSDSLSRMLLIRDDRTADLYDMQSGAHLAGRALPAAGYDPENPVVAGGVVLLRHPGPDGMAVTAYDPVDMRQIWSRPFHRTRAIRVCGDLACLIGVDGVRAVEPFTGDEKWSQPGWTGVETYGSRLVAYGSPGGDDPIAVADTATGRPVVDLGGWRPVSGDPGHGEMLLTRMAGDGTRTMVAVVAPGAARPRLVAELPQGTGECRAAPSRLICRSMYGELVVGEYLTTAGAG
ncbi:PQQ-binding-like beta-propeller repeat protein [Actinoplanes rectilineatus]|uniref:outer membrane protein assembly factor BamB family protein n=1 Tax=Actinoplanes rectilineatus TaxID=113571 RepID=UPI0005F2BCCC|nr:PQQ-binding-like beta-propeller repeat protein [Actinoplanes rectilineatus]